MSTYKLVIAAALPIARQWTQETDVLYEQKRLAAVQAAFDRAGGRLRRWLCGHGLWKPYTPEAASNHARNQMWKARWKMLGDPLRRAPDGPYGEAARALAAHLNAEKIFRTLDDYQKSGVTEIWVDENGRDMWEEWENFRSYCKRVRSAV